jgi:MFS family permease
MVGTTSYVAARVPGRLQATAQALFGSTAFAIGTIAGAVMAGQVAAIGGLWAVYPVGGVIAAVGALMVWAAIGRRPAGRSATEIPRPT